MGDVATDYLKNKYKTYDIMMGSEKVQEPPMFEFTGWELACELLYNAIYGNRLIMIHADVDWDGAGAAKLCKKFLMNFVNAMNIGICINGQKVHGIEQKHVEYFNNTLPGGLVIIVDSSSNAIDLIRKMKCDVIVMDHHDITVREEDLTGNTDGGRYIVINNLRAKEPEHEMCGTEVVYELFRIYQAYCLSGANKDYLKASRLYQYVGITLFTDSIPLDTFRNQWYIQNSFDETTECEEDIQKMITGVNKYQKGLDKSFINYTLGPIVNRAVRAGESAKILTYLDRMPDKLLDFLPLKQRQIDIVNEGIVAPYTYESFVLKDLSLSQITRSYCGIIANKLLDIHKKTSCVYKVSDDGMAVGSFRGLDRNCNYRQLINSIQGCWAEGHPTAFGFGIPLNILWGVMDWLTKQENKGINNPFMSVGNIPAQSRGILHFNSLWDAAQSSLLYSAATVNSYQLDYDGCIILADNTSGNIQLVNDNTTYYDYRAFGLDCRAFEPIVTPYVNVYVEVKGGMQAYLRNINREL